MPYVNPCRRSRHPPSPGTACIDRTQELRGSAAWRQRSQRTRHRRGWPECCRSSAPILRYNEDRRIIRLLPRAAHVVSAAYFDEAIVGRYHSCCVVDYPVDVSRHHRLMAPVPIIAAVIHSGRCTWGGTGDFNCPRSAPRVKIIIQITLKRIMLGYQIDLIEKIGTP